MRVVSPVPHQARILLVDNRVENLIALDAILSPLNQILVPVRSGEQALQALRAEEFALVLLDILMPGMSGFETAARIKREARTRDVPIIFLTAGPPHQEQVFLGYDAGGVDYLAKPFDPGVLKAKVAVSVDLYLKAQPAPGPGRTAGRQSRWPTSCPSGSRRSRKRRPSCARCPR